MSDFAQDLRRAREARGPRPPYLHPDGAYVSIGFASGPDTLLAVGEGKIDRERAAMWVEQVRAIMEERNRVKR